MVVSFLHVYIFSVAKLSKYYKQTLDDAIPTITYRSKILISVLSLFVFVCPSNMKTWCNSCQLFILFSNTFSLLQIYPNIIPKIT